MKHLLFVSAILCAIVTASCGDNATPVKPKDVLFSGNLSRSASTFSVIHAVNYISVTDSQEMIFANAVLGGDSTVNTVAFEGHALDLRSTSADSATRIYQAMFSAGASPLGLDGNFYTFTTSGSWGGWFSDSLQGPGSRICITSHDFGDTVSSSSGFTVTWMPSSSAQSSAVAVRDTTSGSGSRSCGVKYASIDGGSATFSTSELACLAPGPVWITVSRGCMKSDSVAAGKYYSIIYRNTLTIRLFLD